MKTYLLFGIEGDEIHVARVRLERALESRWTCMRADIDAGSTIRQGDVGEHFILQKNFDDVEEERDWSQLVERTALLRERNG
ncbi:MAG: hypothetical protein U0168_25490 [Nannocystaceae bacterium]